jgi:hypothetical protein
MALKKIISIGFELASEAVQHEGLDSGISLLDWDVILYKPNFLNKYCYSSDKYRGKPTLDDEESHKFKQYCAHWYREIYDAVNNGKLVIVFLSELEEVYIATGEKTYSGTGRNRQATRIVTLANNYSSIPIALNPVATKGKLVKLLPKGTEHLSSYWKDFSHLSFFNVVISGEKIKPILQTNTGGKVVGAEYHNPGGNGSLILLPNLDFYSDEYFIENEDGEHEWSQEADEFSEKLVKAIISIDKAIHSSGVQTAEPGWALVDEYKLSNEITITKKVNEIEVEIKESLLAKSLLEKQLAELGRTRSLLYEKGKPLEHVILDALRLMGFTASPFENADSEFDAVFVTEEGRLIGEVEGKDNKAINVEKLRQLSMNIHEDLAMEHVSEPAKGVLFGNAYRLTPPLERECAFTAKCISAAEQSSTALVSTVELFKVVHSLLESPDPEYAKVCRFALLNTSGLVIFPERNVG